MSEEPTVVASDALAGSRIAISVSESSDLARLGLSPAHLELVVAELARAVVIAGGTLVYGGAINRGFTSVIVDEIERFGTRPGVFEHLVPYTEHADSSDEELRAYEASLGVRSTVRLVDAAGTARSVAERGTAAFSRGDIEPAAALTAMRQWAADRTDARVLVGGKLADFTGSLPGIAEEASTSLAAGKPIYVAGGYGGAATLVGRLLAPDLYSWLPGDMPTGLRPDVEASVSSALAGVTAVGDGLPGDERALLAATTRPSDIATLSILGLSRLRARGDAV